MLPKIQHRTIRTTLPSSGREVKFRPMTGREEKILLVAKESGEDREILSSVMQVVDGCVLEEDFSSERSPIFDVEWLFVQIRMASISPESRVAYLDHSDEKRYEFDVDLSRVEVERPDAPDGVIRVSEDVAVELRWPSAGAFLDADVVAAETDADSARILGAMCVERVYDGDEATEADSEPRTDLLEFVDSLDLESYEHLMAWVAACPSLRYVIQYQNSRGEEREIVLQNLTDFFRFR